jgi:predicted neuraminidase
MWTSVSPWYAATSADGGRTWSKAAASKLPNNNSGLQAATLVGRCRLTVSIPVLKARLVSALEAKI